MSADLGARPCVRGDVVTVPLGNGLLAFEPATRRLHSLNASAALVWQRLDGTVTVGALATQLGARYAADRAVVCDDVVAVIDRFAALGLLRPDTASSSPAATSDGPAAHPASEGATASSGTGGVDDAVGAAMRRRLDGHAWAWTSDTHQALDLSFRVRTDDATVGAELARVLRPLRRPGVAASATYSVQRSADAPDRWLVHADGTALGTVAAADTAVALVLWHLDQAAVRSTPRALCFHAGAVQAGGSVVLLASPATPASSALTCVLVRRGLGYVADGVAAYDLTHSAIVPYPKAFGLPAEGPAALADLTPPSALAHPPMGATRRRIDPATIRGLIGGRGGPVGLVVAPHHVAGAATLVERRTDDEAVRVLLDTTFASEPLHAERFAALVDSARRTPVYRVQYGDFDAACEVVLELVREQMAPRA